MPYVVAIMIVILSALLAKELESKKIQGQKEVLGEVSQSSPSPQPTLTPTSTPTPKPTSSPIPKPSESSSNVEVKQEVKDDSSTNVNFNLSDFRYPDSSQLESTDRLVLESSDDPKTITDWYKDKIRNLGFKSKSFVQTSTNGNILNKLVGASSNKQVKVEIEKKADESKSRIRLEFSAT